MAFSRTSTFQARTGEKLESLQNENYVATLLAQTRHMGIFAITSAILVWFVLFFGFQKAELWAW